MMDKNGVFTLRPLGVILDREEPGDDELVTSLWLKKKVFNGERHKFALEPYETVAQSWRMKERMKTVSVALVLCLNIGVDPPDTIKISPCAKDLCWIDPKKLSSDLNSSSSQKPIEVIGAALQKQYERWQPRARYKLSLDSTMEDVKKLCTSLRRNAKDERVLFHFNGFGVPRPTENGEVWVFNKQYTQYIPLSVCDLHLWMGRPSIYVFDCSNAGNVVEFLKNLLQQPAKSETKDHTEKEDTSKHGILLAACQSHQTLPQTPDVPADLFTACLTTPIRIALKWYVLSNISILVPSFTTVSADEIPGQLNDRRTMLGELNWIFTAITDTIAWNVLPRELFQKLFRQDLLVASLFRNFLLAERVMSHYNCTPVSVPSLPPTRDHHMWLAWDYALDGILCQVPSVLTDPGAFHHSSFFSEQLTGFEVWLRTASTLISQDHTPSINPPCPPPEQLPIVLQVLLSQVHRQRALDLLASFLDLGAWAVNLALSVGIFPYVLKLLQSSARELKPLLVFIWAKLLSVDSSCQADLIKDNGHKYFLDILSDTALKSEDRMVAAFVLSLIVDNYLSGKDAVVKSNVISTCLLQLQDGHAGLRLWVVLCLSKVWQHYDTARWVGVRDSAHEKLALLLQDAVPEVRAATVYSLGTFLTNSTERDDHVIKLDQSIANFLLATLQDGSPIVRKELLIAMSGFVNNFLPKFEVVAQQSNLSKAYHTVISPNSREYRGVMQKSTSKSPASEVASAGDTFTPRALPMGVHGRASHVVMGVWGAMVGLKQDPHPPISTLASSLCDEVRKMASIDLGKMRSRNTSQPPIPSDTPFNTTLPHNSSINLSSSFFRWCCRQFSEPNSKLKLNSLTQSDPSTDITLNPDEAFNNRDDPSSLNKRQTTTYPSTNNKPSNNINLSTTNNLSFINPAFNKYPSTITNLPSPITNHPSTTTNHPSSTTNHPSTTTNHPSTTTTNLCHLPNFQVGSADWYEMDLLYNRAARVLTLAPLEQLTVAKHRLDDLLISFKLSRHVTLMTFHPYEPHLAVVEDANIHFFDWEGGGGKVCTLNNGSMPHTKITHLSFLNPHHNTLLLTATNEGMVKVWRGYESDKPEQVSSWVALSNIKPMSHSPGLVMDWQEHKHLLASCGNVPYVRLWDVNAELILKDILLEQNTHCSTTISFTPDPNTLVVGMLDGAVKVFDLRVHKNSQVKEFKESYSRVLKVSCPNRSEHSLVSARVSGEVSVHDLRNDRLLHKHPPTTTNMASSSYSISFPPLNPLIVFDCHLYADLFVCNTSNNVLSAFDHQCVLRHSIKQPRPVSSLTHITLHPHKVKLATASEHHVVSVYGLQGGKRK